VQLSSVPAPMLAADPSAWSCGGNSRTAPDSLTFLSILLGVEVAADSDAAPAGTGDDTGTSDGGNSPDGRSSARTDSDDSEPRPAVIPSLTVVPPAFILPFRFEIPTTTNEPATVAEESASSIKEAGASTDVCSGSDQSVATTSERAENRLLAGADLSAVPNLVPASTVTGAESAPTVAPDVKSVMTVRPEHTEPASPEEMPLTIAPASDGDNSGIVGSTSDRGVKPAAPATPETGVKLDRIDPRTGESGQPRKPTAFRIVLEPHSQERQEVAPERPRSAVGSEPSTSAASPAQPKQPETTEPTRWLAASTSPPAVDVAQRTVTTPSPSRQQENSVRNGAQPADHTPVPSPSVGAHRDTSDDPGRDSERKREDKALPSGAPTRPPARSEGNESPQWQFSTAPAERTVIGNRPMVKEPPAPAPMKAADLPAEAPRPAAVREIALTLPNPESRTVDLHIVDARGKVHVEVRTDDPNLASTLRDNVGDLVQKLDGAGYRTESISARDENPKVSAAAWTDHRASHIGQKGPVEQEQQSGGGSNGHSGQEQSQQQGHPRGNRPRWIEEIRRNLQTGSHEEENDYGNN
jgi:hypothetical protein